MHSLHNVHRDAVSFTKLSVSLPNHAGLPPWSVHPVQGAVVDLLLQMKVPGLPTRAPKQATTQAATHTAAMYRQRVYNFSTP